MTKPIRLIPLCTLVAAASAADFTREIIATGFHDPMEVDISANGDAFVIEREGRVLRVIPETGAVLQIARLPVTALREADKDSGWAREDGLLGIALDPNFTDNHHIFLYYSHPVEMCNRLSRFTMVDGMLDLTTEQTLFDVATDRRDRVCHQGGSLQFAANGDLYLSCGDNTNPFESDGFAPIDDRPGHEHANAMRSAGNTNDLRGKILRIRPTADGYVIPDGNLFPSGTDGTRAEIYAMGCRNPFRMSIDPHTGTIYWGEVGPDSRNDDPRGPMGYDELNQAREPGNFGWPFLIADNQPYAIYDFESKKITGQQDPQAPVNPARDHPGLHDLPPAVPAMIWYPYVDSKEFPMLGSGGRNAMAGPVIYPNHGSAAAIIPAGAEKALMFYEWMRGGIWSVGLDADESLTSVTKVVDGLTHPMDLERDRENNIWLLEYGSAWYFNSDGALSILRDSATPMKTPPVITAVEGTPRSYTVAALAAHEHVRWYGTLENQDIELGNGRQITLPDQPFSDVRAVLHGRDGTPGRARLILTGATPQPALKLTLDIAADTKANFGDSLTYAVTTAEGSPPAGIRVRARYIPPTGHDAGGPELARPIRAILTEKLCFACHQVDQTSVGPAYLDVALRYQEDPAATQQHLQGLFKNGSTGRWGEIPMPPQPTVDEATASQLITAILSLADGMGEARDEAAGTLLLPAEAPAAAPGGAWEITAEAAGFTTARLRIPAGN